MKVVWKIVYEVRKNELGTTYVTAPDFQSAMVEAKSEVPLGSDFKILSVSYKILTAV